LTGWWRFRRTPTSARLRRCVRCSRRGWSTTASSLASRLSRRRAASLRTCNWCWPHQRVGGSAVSLGRLGSGHAADGRDGRRWIRVLQRLADQSGARGVRDRAQRPGRVRDRPGGSRPVPRVPNWSPGPCSRSMKIASASTSSTTIPIKARTLTKRLPTGSGRELPTGPQENVQRSETCPRCIRAVRDDGASEQWALSHQRPPSNSFAGRPRRSDRADR
jgi:hypothetical protein